MVRQTLPDGIEMIGLAAFNGSDELDLVGLLEVFRRAAQLGAGIEANIVTRRPQGSITGATMIHKRVLGDGEVVTSGGVTSGIDLALSYVSREFGNEIAVELAVQIECPQAPDQSYDA